MQLLDKVYYGPYYSAQTWKILQKSDFKEGIFSIGLDRKAGTLYVTSQGTTNDGTTFAFDLDGKYVYVPG